MVRRALQRKSRKKKKRNVVRLQSESVRHRSELIINPYLLHTISLPQNQCRELIWGQHDYKAFPKKKILSKINCYCVTSKLKHSTYICGSHFGRTMHCLRQAKINIF